MSGYTIYVTYCFDYQNGINNFPIFGENSYGYAPAAYCNYINVITATTLNGKNVTFYFPDINDFSFMSSDESKSNGWTANKIYAIIQIVDNSLFSDNQIVKPFPDQWKIIDVTSQINGYTDGDLLTADNLTETVFTVSINQYNLAQLINLTYLNYPSQLSTDDDKLCFGEETVFLGNVKTDIEAIAYTGEIVVDLPLNEYNTTTNKTWDGVSSTYISEVGIYDDENNLVAIGKLNDPLIKNSTIARSIVFSLDF